MSGLIKIETTVNKDENQLPLSYFHPETEGKLTWNCGYDQQNKIVSVYRMKDGDQDERKTTILNNMGDVFNIRDTLKDHGWLPTKPPEIKIKNEDGVEKPLNRKQKRKLAVQIQKAANNEAKNPIKKEKDI